jgi:DNA mismatch endonuclease (patch repair protein)
VPDIVFRQRRCLVLVHGCFWHRHSCANGMRLPKSRVQFWRNKLQANKARDARTCATLRELGWRVLVVWECELAKPERLARRLQRFLG